MIALKIKDINGRVLTIDSKIRMVDSETEEVYGKESSVRLVLTDDDTYEIRAFETDLSYKRISNGTYAQPFLIV